MKFNAIIKTIVVLTRGMLKYLYSRLYNGKAAEQELKSLQDQVRIELCVQNIKNPQQASSSFTFGKDLIKHNLVVFRSGEGALQVNSFELLQHYRENNQQWKWFTVFPDFATTRRRHPWGPAQPCENFLCQFTIDSSWNKVKLHACLSFRWFTTCDRTTWARPTV